MDKLKMSTPDLTDKNIEQIGALFPNVITETRDENGAVKKAVDFDLLKQALSKNLVEDDNERYRLDWPGKKASLLKANTPITKTLRPCREESVNFDTTENLYIEGDNFEVLKILQESYLGKIKMIYIDPPYNTGNDFIYKDNFAKSKDEYEEELGTTDEEGGKLFRNTDRNGRYHSDWLSMMYERLVVARDLLKDDGVIFISIDENEVHNLRNICDEVFGENNRLSTHHIQVRYANKTLNEKNDWQPVMEYVYIYSKNSDIFKPGKEKEDYEISKFVFEFKELTKGTDFIIKGRKVTLFKNGEWEIIKHAEPKIGLLKETWVSGSIYTGTGNGQMVQNVIEPRVNADGYGALYKIDGLGEDGLGYRYFMGPQTEGATRAKMFSGVPTVKVEELSNGTAVKSKSIPNIVVFDDYSPDFGNIVNEGGVKYNSGKKPVKLLINLIKICNLGNDDIVLDFFAGSATTAHAVMQLNSEDAGNRKFILVQLPEVLSAEIKEQKDTYDFLQSINKPCILSELGKERIRRAGKKILDELKAKNQQLEIGQEPVDPTKLDIGFRVYKTDTTNMKDVFYHPSELKQDQLDLLESNIKEDRTPEDLLTQIILDLGLELTLPIETKQILGNTVFIVQTNALVACFDKDIDFNIVDTISDLKPLKVVFKDASFKDDKDRINVEERFKRLSPETKVTVI